LSKWKACQLEDLSRGEEKKNCCEVEERRLGAMGSVVYIPSGSALGDANNSSGQVGGDRWLMVVRVANIVVILGVVT
jgi:hypothetical protein